MNDKLRENYFTLTRLALLVALSVYGIFYLTEETGVSIRILLLISLYIGIMSVKELCENRVKYILLVIAVVVLTVLIYFYGRGFFLLIFYTLFEVMFLFRQIDIKWYFLTLFLCFLDRDSIFLSNMIIVFAIALLYVQHNYVVKGYEKRMKEDVEKEQILKRNIREQEFASREELKRNMLETENQILEERASLSQTLHDKLGHNINGSIYQLEGVKLLMDTDPEKSKNMIQAVINQLRTGMDEIRGILRKQRPEKRELALLQLYKLCEDCNKMGVETEFNKEGDLSIISDALWEVILDNAYEAVSNSMKYAKCKNIHIELIILNKMVRCTIKDDGIGCKEIKDGMGISGMRQRVRGVNGTLSFETEAGFVVTMFLPL